jgi:hypothetical protein
LTSLEDELTLVATLVRPFLSVRPSCSSTFSPDLTTSLYVASPSFAALGSSESSIVTGSSTPGSASARKASTVLSVAAGSAARGRAPAPSLPTRTIQHRLPPFWKKP